MSRLCVRGSLFHRYGALPVFSSTLDGFTMP